PGRGRRAARVWNDLAVREDPITVGVEEEFLVVDPATRSVVAASAAVIDHAKPVLGERVGGEFTAMQVETRTAPCTGVEELHDQLASAREELARAAAATGVAVVATGTPVLGRVAPAAITDGERQRRGDELYRGLHDEITVCAVHVHLHVPDRDRAVLVSNHLRRYLPLLIALCANSPYWCGRDTGYASWRSISLQRWPVAGPPPYFTDAGHYDATVSRLLDTGALVDQATLFWDIRLSHHLPTVELRVPDVPLTAAGSALLATLARALVRQAQHAIDRGDSGPVLAPELLRVAYWRAARDGMGGVALDPHTGATRPAHAAVIDLFQHLRPYLGADHRPAERWLTRLLGTGNGATQQRAAGRPLTRVVDHLIATTAPRRAAPVRDLAADTPASASSADPQVSPTPRGTAASAAPDPSPAPGAPSSGP
ncbi:MAG: carboxylate-amine ligase, partial [Micromonosporaceae bacterium]